MGVGCVPRDDLVVTHQHVDLGGVPETLLWTLYLRAQEARRPDAVLHDPLAIDLIRRLGYPFERFGGRQSLLAQAQALRVRCFDVEVEHWVSSNPHGTVVVLGAGLETQ